MRPALARAVPEAHRLVVVYVPNGIIMNDWLPKDAGKDFTFSRIVKPLEPFRSDITVVSGLVNHGPNKARGGGHVAAKPQPAANLFVETMNGAGVETAAFADSSKRLDLEG